MKVLEYIGELKGVFFLTRRNLLTGEIDRFNAHNIFTNKGKWLTLRLYANHTGITGLKYLAIGTGTSAEAATQTTLDAEVASGGRQPITLFTMTEDGAPYQMTTSAFWDATTPGSTVVIGEIGIFGGTATSTKDSGYMLARAKLASTVTKTAGVHTLDIDYALSF